MDPFALHKLSYGLYILSTVDNNIPYGCIINTAFQITSKPPRIAVSCNRDNFTHDMIVSSGVFGVSVLSESCDSAIIGTFGYQSGKDIDKFSDVKYSSGKETGVPLFDQECMTTFECKVVDSVEVGTHTIFVGEVLSADITQPDQKEMTYRFYHEVLKGAAPKNAPTYIEQEPAQAPASVNSSGDLWKCSVCGYVYDPSEGTGDVASGTQFEDLPDDWSCPICGVAKDMFVKIE